MHRIALIDVDGTLVDSNYHHAIAWARAFEGRNLTLPLWQLHRHLGMGGDQFVPAVAGDRVEETLGQELRDEWKRRYDALLPEVQPAAGAREFLEELRRAGWTTILASSGAADHTDHYLDLLGVREVVDGWTTSADVEATKPSPDLIHVALQKAGEGEAVLIGDSPWDVVAAERAGLPTVCVLTGGFAESELRDAGAAAVYRDLDELRGAIDALPVAVASGTGVTPPR
jgi:HAD superfamily hydrolase (TIGR01509 family)